MVTQEILATNLEILRNTIPKKPATFVADYPKSISEGLFKYSNQRSVNALSQNTNSLNKLNWPLPLWVNPDDIKIGYWNLKAYKKFHNSWDKRIKFRKFIGFDWLWVPVLGNTFSNHKIDTMLPEVFDVNVKYIRRKLIENRLLATKEIIIIEFFEIYKSRHYSACISTLFPLVDFVIRKILKTNSLTTSVNKICNLFKECGFDVSRVDHLMPSAALQNFIYADNIDQYAKNLQSPKFHQFAGELDKYNFGIIGPALSSFLLFSNNYYGYYKEDINETNILNRHAILHGSVNSFNNKINAIKLLTYFYLILELEPVFQLLFKVD